MIRAPGRFSIHLLAGGAGFLLASAVWSASAKPSCVRVALEKPPASIANATWLHGDEGLAILDNGTRSLVLYGLDGKRTRRVSSPGGDPLDFNVPLGIQQTESGYLVNDENQHFVWLDGSFKGVESFDLRARPDGADELWLDGQSIVNGKGAIGVLSRNGRRGSDYGVFRLRLQQGAEPELIEAIGVPGDVHHSSGTRWAFRFYQTAYKVIARIADRTYWLRLDGSRRLHLLESRAAATPTDLGSIIPTEYSQWPQALPEDMGVQDVPGVLATLERSSIVSGLFTDGERLFLLAHAPASQGVRWTILALDPAARRIEFERTLPTSAPEIIVLAGPRKTALLEFGPVTGHLRPPTKLAVLSHEWLERLPSGGKEPTCDTGRP